MIWLLKLYVNHEKSEFKDTQPSNMVIQWKIPAIYDDLAIKHGGLAAVVAAM